MNKFKSLALLTATSASLALSACGTSSMIMRDDVADRVSAPAWMVKREIPAGIFALTAFERIHNNGSTANIYIEGDGLSWVSRSQRSLNPTPKNPVALHLASKDKAENVIYLARPCQFSQLLDETKPCNADYWSGKRFAPDVIEAYNDALDEIKQRYGITGFNLVGFSGGAAVAALLAADRGDVLTLRTVAGNLDHRTHSAHHNVSFLSGSLNPIDKAARLKNIPQYHFIGGQDKVVPPEVLSSYVQALSPTSCLQYEFIQEAEHEEGWVDKWPELLEKMPTCHTTPPPAFEYEPQPQPIFRPRIDREVK